MKIRNSGNSDSAQKTSFARHIMPTVPNKLVLYSRSNKMTLPAGYAVVLLGFSLQGIPSYPRVSPLYCVLINCHRCFHLAQSFLIKKVYLHPRTFTALRIHNCPWIQKRSQLLVNCQPLPKPQSTSIHLYWKYGRTICVLVLKTTQR